MPGLSRAIHTLLLISQPEVCDWREGRIFFPDGDPVQFSMTPSLQAGIHIQYSASDLWVSSYDALADLKTLGARMAWLGLGNHGSRADGFNDR